MTSLKIGVIYLVAFLNCHREERNVVHCEVNDIKIYWLFRQRWVSLTAPASPRGVLRFFKNTIWSKCFSREVSTLLYTSKFLLEFSFHYRTEEVRKYFSLNMWFNGFSSLLLFFFFWFEIIFFSFFSFIGG